MPRSFGSWVHEHHRALVIALAVIVLVTCKPRGRARSGKPSRRYPASPSQDRGRPAAGASAPPGWCGEASPWPRPALRGSPPCFRCSRPRTRACFVSDARFSAGAAGGLSGGGRSFQHGATRPLNVLPQVTAAVGAHYAEVASMNACQQQSRTPGTSQKNRFIVIRDEQIVRGRNGGVQRGKWSAFQRLAASLTPLSARPRRGKRAANTASLAASNAVTITSGSRARS